MALEDWSGAVLLSCLIISVDSLAYSLKSPVYQIVRYIVLRHAHCTTYPLVLRIESFCMHSRPSAVLSRLWLDWISGILQGLSARVEPVMVTNIRLDAASLFLLCGRGKEFLGLWRGSALCLNRYSVPSRDNHTSSNPWSTSSTVKSLPLLLTYKNP